ncbi:MAG: TldD/PmbA family protein, partial [Thermoplasmata archaeon]
LPAQRGRGGTGMTDTVAGPATAERIASGLGPELEAPWEIFGEQLLHHELHLNGRRIELRRGPIEVEGYALRIFRPTGDGRTRIGFASSNDLSPEGLRRALRTAETTAQYSSFPAPSIPLGPPRVPSPGPSRVDPRLRDAPSESILDFAQALLAEFPDSGEVTPSFGSIRATHGESSIVNSSGLAARQTGSRVDFEWAVKASGGPEGRPPGEYWVNCEARRLDRDELGIDVPAWLARAQDVRRAEPPPSGASTVLFPPEVLRDIVPATLGYRLSGAAELRKIAVPIGEVVGSPMVSVRDDPTIPGGFGSEGFDDEGRPGEARVMVEEGTVRGHYYDLTHAAALGTESTASGHRILGTFPPWVRFTNSVQPGPSNLLIQPGAGGSDRDLIETAGEGIWLDQLGYAFPDPFAGTFGGEIRLGYRIRGGRLAEPVRGGTVGGLVLGPAGAPSLLRGVAGVGNKARPVGAFRSPTLLAEGILVAGSGPTR